VLLLIVLLPLFLGTAATLWLGSRSRWLTALTAGAVTAASLGLLLGHAPAVMAGEVILNAWAWVPEIGLNLTFRLDGLSMMFAGLILFIGLMIVIYAHYYLSPKDSVGKFYSEMMLFMAAMLGVVLSDNLLLLVVFWELTSLSSFLLVGYWSHRADARAGARQALAVTGGGGLAMLGGFVLLGQIAGTYELSAMLGKVAAIQADPMFVPALLLILIGCLHQERAVSVPFLAARRHGRPHAGVGLPALGHHGEGRRLPAHAHVPGAGGLGLVRGDRDHRGPDHGAVCGLIAIFKHDLKGLLAYSTVSHLGLITFLVGLGSPLAAVAAVFHVLNHATFKASLFMIAGHRGPRNPQPRHAQAGRPVGADALDGHPLHGGGGVHGRCAADQRLFVQRDVLHRSGGGHHRCVGLAGAGGGHAGRHFSVAYSLRFVHDTYFNGPLGDVPNTHPHEPPLGMKLPAMLLVAMCIAVGLLPAITFGPLVDVAATALAGKPLPEYHLAIWHGFNLPLLMSAIALVAGVGLYLLLAAAQAAAPHRVRGLVWRGHRAPDLRPPDRRAVRPGGAHLGAAGKRLAAALPGLDAGRRHCRGGGDRAGQRQPHGHRAA
jgi:multicomponent K+:H+ antiporter subunit A